MDITVRKVPHPGVAPQTAFAKLRSYTPGRGAFLFESRPGAKAEGRFSIVGYRIRRLEMSPPGVDAIAMIHESCASDEPESFAQALAMGSMGYVSAAHGNLRHKLGLHDDEGPSSMLCVGAAVMVYDHDDDSVTVAGATKGNLVERLLWELENGPEIGPLPSHDPDARPATVKAMLEDDKVEARAQRAKAYLEELDALVLSNTYSVPLGELDLFDIYRLMWATSDAPHGYYLDFGQLPYTPDTRMAGVADSMLYLRRHGQAEESALDEALHRQIPLETSVGAPTRDAIKLLKNLEENSRQQWGGGIGYACPGGAAAFVPVRETLVAESGNLFFTSGFEMTEDTDPATVAEGLHRDARHALSLVASLTK